MADRPILFSSPMVRALLSGRKTQTRRILKPQPYEFVTDGNRYWNASGVVGGRICISDRGLLDIHRKPRVGDRFWVRESLSQCSRDPHLYAYAADDTLVELGERYYPVMVEGKRSIPSIHMCRFASRLTLTVTDIRVQRLQDISHLDAYEEGVDTDIWDMCVIARDYSELDAWFYTWPDAFEDGGIRYVDDLEQIFRRSYATLWNSINGVGAWDLNPWVAAYTFTVERRNINDIRDTP